MGEYSVVNYREIGGAKDVIGGEIEVVSGGTATVASGGSLVVESGATFTTAVEQVTSVNVGTAGTGVTAVEYGNGAMHKTILTVAAYTQAIAGANLGFGKSIYTMPAGIIKFDYATIDLTVSAPTETATPDAGLGTVVASGVITALNGTATFEDIMDGFTVTAITSGGSDTNNYVAAEAGLLDGHTTPKAVFLNMAGAWGSTENLTISAVVTLFWTNLGDY